MDLFSTLNIAASGLTANREWMDLISGNIANANVTRTPEGGPFRRQLAIFMENRTASNENLGVKISDIVEDSAELRKEFNPSHPDADADGYVSYPNVNVVMEMVDLIAASRAYEANATVLEAAKNGMMRAVQLLQA